MADSLPPLQFAVRSRKGFQVFQGAVPAVAPVNNLSGEAASGLEYSIDGSLLGVLDATGVTIFNTATGALVQKIARPHVTVFAFSPNWTFVVTWERLEDTTAGAAPVAGGEVDGSGSKRQPGNLIVWEVASGKEVTTFAQKHFSKELWPSVRWTADESVAARNVTNEVHFFDGKNMAGGFIDKLRQPGVAKFELAPGPGPVHVATVVPEIKGAPARVSIFHFGQLKDGQALASKSFFKAEKVELKWNSTGTALLVVTHTEVDTTGKSYYGETGLFFLTTDGKTQTNVTLQKEGPLHDVQWNPNGKEFVVVHGFMPARSILYDFKCQPIFDFGALPRNTALWSPSGRFLCLGGFGNLQGDMDFWDRSRQKKMASAQSSCSVSFQWAPDGRHFLTGVLFPRLRVDNGYKVFRYDGTLILSEKGEEVYQVTWRPALPDIYPDRPQSPRARPDPSSPVAAATNGTATPSPPVRAGAYRHPNASGATASLFLRQDEEAAGKIRAAGAAGPVKAAPAKVLPPGYSAEDVSKAASKNKKKRDAKKKKKAEGDDEDSGDDAAADVSKISLSSPAPAPVPPPTAPEPSDSPADIEKKIKAVSKKLRQIEGLREQKASGKPLDALQEEKLLTEASLKKELNDLQEKAAKS